MIHRVCLSPFTFFESGTSFFSTSCLINYIFPHTTQFPSLHTSPSVIQDYKPCTANLNMSLVIQRLILDYSETPILRAFLILIKTTDKESSKFFIYSHKVTTFSSRTYELLLKLFSLNPYIATMIHLDCGALFMKLLWKLFVTFLLHFADAFWVYGTGAAWRSAANSFSV